MAKQIELIVRFNVTVPDEFPTEGAYLQINDSDQSTRVVNCNGDGPLDQKINEWETMEAQNV